MWLQSIRWNISEAVRRTLLSARRDGLLIRAYKLLKSAPGVKWVWRQIERGGRPWQHMDLYTRRTPPPFEDNAFFDDLLERIRQATPERKEPETNLCVLINNGLSAGGAERQIAYTLRGLSERGLPVDFVGEYLGLAPGLDFHASSLEEAGISVRPLRRRRREPLAVYKAIPREIALALAQIPPHVLMEMLDMIDELRELRPSVVHLWQDETSTKHAISALIAGVPRIVLSGRNLNPTHFGYHLPHMRNAYQALGSHPAVVFSNNSHAGARSYASWLGFDVDRIRVIHNGLDVDTWPVHQPSDIMKWRESRRIRPGQSFVLGVMRFSQEKRPLLWLEVAARVRAGAPDTRFAIAGDGPMKPEVLNRIAELRLQDSIILLGEIPDVSTAIAAADAFMLVSAQEGLPNVLLEAQWYGRPCLITDAGGAREAIREGVTGVIAQSDTAEGIAQNLLGLLQNRDLRDAASREGPVFIREAFGIKRMIDETLALYDASPATRQARYAPSIRGEKDQLP
jgi:glycosyltransferase involved in cell wall biosynthesis